MSLRTRLVSLFCGVLVLALLFGGAATYLVMRNTLVGRIDAQLNAVADPIVQVTDHVGLSTHCGLRLHPGPPRGSPGRLPHLAQPPFSSVYLAARSSDGALRYACAAYLDSKPISPRLPSEAASLAALGSASRVVLTVSGRAPGEPAMRLLIAKVRGGTVYVALPLTDVESTLHNLLMIELLALGATVLLATAMAAIAIRSGLRPLRDIEVAATRISAGAFDERVEVDRAPNEVRRVGTAMNAMLDEVTRGIDERDALVTQLRDRDEQLRRFVADASHELRTPIAAVAAYVELFDRGAAAHPQDLSRVLEGIGKETVRMQRLVDDLLTLARLDEGLRDDVQDLDVLELADDAAELARALAPRWPVDVVGEASVLVLGNHGQLRRVVDNLLANVREHTPEGTRTTMTVREDGARALVEVADDGPGMAATVSAHAFDRFSRGQPGRDRSSGGAGLGLSIVEAIVHAHGGTVALATLPGHGTTVSIELPLVGSRASEPAPI